MRSGFELLTAVDRRQRGIAALVCVVAGGGVLRETQLMHHYHHRRAVTGEQRSVGAVAPALPEWRPAAAE